MTTKWKRGQLQSVAGFPPMMWMVDYNAECPNCGRLVTLTSRDGGAGYMCEGRADYSCDFYGESENVTHEDALKAILEG